MKLITDKESFIELMEGLDSFKVKIHKTYWDVYSIELDTGIIKLDVIGKSQNEHVDNITDCMIDGVEYSIDFVW